MSTFRLGTAAFAVLGVWWVLQALWSVQPVLQLAENALNAQSRRELAVMVLCGLLLPAALGAALFVWRVPLARRLFGDDEEPVAGPSLEDLQAVAFSGLGVWIAADGAYRILRVVLPFAVYGDRQSAPWGEIGPDLLVAGVAVLLFFQGRALARLWSRASAHQSTAA